MADEPDLSDTIATNAANPKSMTVDGENVTEHSLPDQILADRYAKANRRRRGMPFRTVKLRPGGNHDLNIGDR